MIAIAVGTMTGAVTMIVAATTIAAVTTTGAVTIVAAATTTEGRGSLRATVVPTPEAAEATTADTETCHGCFSFDFGFFSSVPYFSDCFCVF